MSTPRETFLSDQALAMARDIAADGRTIPIVLDPAHGQPCTWCDCPDGPDSPHNNPGYRCGGCTTPADIIVRVFVTADRRTDYPACDRHHAEIIAAVATAGRGGRP